MANKPEAAIDIQRLYKSFKLPHEKHGGIKQAVIGLFNGKKGYEVQKALKDISFQIDKGQFFGIVGRNGSGKSTLLKLLAGIYMPDSGQVQINGSLTPFIELGVGFNPELTGRENVFLNGALLGLSRKEVALIYDDIVSFAELEKFMDQKLKNYSSGMQVRLAFSIAIRAKSDILLLDEVLAVGDAIFQRKCFNYFKELKRSKRTVVLVSHDSGVLEEYCDAGVLIDDGVVKFSGKITEVVRKYTKILNEQEAKSKNLSSKEASMRRWGEGDAKVLSCKSTSANGAPRDLFSDADKNIYLEVGFVATVDKVASPVYGITILDAAGNRVFQSNTLWKKVKTETILRDHQAIVTWKIPNVFNTGDYTVSPAIADEYGTIIYDWFDEAVKLKIRKKLQSSAIINVDHEIELAVDLEISRKEKL